MLAHARTASVRDADYAKYERATLGSKEWSAPGARIRRGCFHPGSAQDSDRSVSAKRVAKAIETAVKAVPGTTRLLVENTAGAGRTMGRTAEEVGEILAHVPASLRDRTGYGLDTCHLFASGHDITMSEDAVARTRSFEITTDKASFFTSTQRGALGFKDRHVLIVDGNIGVEPFRWCSTTRAEGNSRSRNAAQHYTAEDAIRRSYACV